MWGHRIVKLNLKLTEPDYEQFDDFEKTRVSWWSGGSFRDVIVRYIVDKGTISPSADANWSFKPLPGTTVLFDTGPKGKAHLADVKGVEIEATGDGPDRFARYRIKM